MTGRSASHRLSRILCLVILDLFGCAGAGACEPGGSLQAQGGHLTVPVGSFRCTSGITQVDLEETGRCWKMPVSADTLDRFDIDLIRSLIKNAGHGVDIVVWRLGTRARLLII